MTQDEIIEMARQAGIVVTGEAIYTLCKLVAAKEREACAQLCEEWLGPTKDREIHIAAAIRARSTK